MIESVLRGLLGVVSVLAMAWLMSRDRRAVSWRLVGGGLVLQFVFVLLMRYVPFVGDAFEWVGRGFQKLLDFTDEGMWFLLGGYYPSDPKASIMVHSFPLIIFFSALVSLFYYWGVIQWVVRAMAKLLSRCMPGVSGAEGLVTSGNVFLGMTESPLLIRPYLQRMTCSELFLVMVSGFGTISGSLIGVYLSIVQAGDPSQATDYTKYLLSACLMAAPAAIVISKIILPTSTKTLGQSSVEETTDDSNGSCVSVKTGCNMKDDEQATNLFDAIVSGTAIGLRLMVNVAATLLVFVALMAMINYLFGLLGEATGLDAWAVEWSGGWATGFTLEFLLGMLMSPVAWLIGVPASDIQLVGSLMGLKVAMNEFVAYLQLQSWIADGLFSSPKSVFLSIYVLCGFANFSSIGILVGGLAILVPSRRDVITRYALLAMIGGSLVSWLSAAMVGLLIP